MAAIILAVGMLMSLALFCIANALDGVRDAILKSKWSKWNV